MNRILLKGCSPAPLAHYLKALGILRLVAEQIDPGAKGAWRDNGFELTTSLDEQGLERFLLENYRPTPVLAPWNGGSGFYPGDNKEGIDPISHGEAARFKPLREAIKQVREVLDDEQLTAKPDGDRKVQLLERLRAQLADELLPWMDAALMLTEEGPKYPPLLGTGGNDGRLDFTNNYLKQLVTLFDPNSGEATGSARQSLPNALFNTPYTGAGKGAIGQFLPGNAGGPNNGNGFEGGSRINSWDFILMLEGALLFAASVCRRLEQSAPSTLSYPFTVRMSGSGAGAAAQSDEANARAEIWLPVWRRPSSLNELKAVFSEGRASLNGKVCRDGLDFARSVAQLGVDRGIDAFQRYAFVMRAGKAYLATPLSLFRVRRSPGADLIEDLDNSGWLTGLRRAARAKEAPGALKTMVQGLENSLFDLTQRTSSATVQAVLIRLGELTQWQARSRKGRDATLMLPKLSSAWLREADDGSDTFRLAAALASLGVGGRLPMRAHLYPLSKGAERGWKLDAEGENALCTWGTGGLVRQLPALLSRRLQADKREPVNVLFGGKTAADLAAVEVFIVESDRDQRIAALLPALSLIDRPFALPIRKADIAALPLAYRLLKPLFCDAAQLREANALTQDQRLVLPPSIPRLLAANRVEDAVAEGMHRMCIAGFSTPKLLPDCRALNGQRLLAALLVPLDKFSLNRLVRSAYHIEANETLAV